jgi:hypothetical protein
VRVSIFLSNPSVLARFKVPPNDGVSGVPETDESRSSPAWILARLGMIPVAAVPAMMAVFVGVVVVPTPSATTSDVFAVTARQTGIYAS